MSDLHRLSANQAVEMLRRRQVSPLELIEIAAARIAAVEPAVNAVPTLCLDRARAHARKIIDGKAPAGLLAGLPILIKDMNDVAGVRTTYGSPIYADHVPPRSDILVETLEANGAVVIGKSNTPEFAHGANTFNEVFGKTRNPWNTATTCGGSSGGAAVALATGEAWLATGSDFGCSLRTPAAFCSVVGLRPSPGRVARGPLPFPYDNLWVEGPMARNCADLALMLDAMVGQHPRDPISLARPERSFVSVLRDPKPPRRVAFSADLGGITPVDGEIAAICRAAAHRFAELGATVEEACPDLSDARATFHVLRAQLIAAQLSSVVTAHRDKVKPEVIWNVEQGEKLTAAAIGKADRARAALYYRVAEFFSTYDMLITPAAILAPFDVDIRYIDRLGNHKFDNFYEWYTICYAITLTSCPALALPAGFTAAGLPVGLQIVGPPRGEAPLLAAGALLEQVLGVADILPIDPRPASA